MAKPLIFTLQRTGGSYVTNILSGGMPIMTEPFLPDNGFGSTLTQNMRRLNDFQTQATSYQVVKLVDFVPYLGFLQDQKLTLPTGFVPFCLFRNPYSQVASFLYKFCGWNDRWTDTAVFWKIIENYRAFYDVSLKIKKKFPKTIFLKYEDSLGAGMADFIKVVYPVNYAAFMANATAVQNLNFTLGPTATGKEFEPADIPLLNKEKFWIYDKLTAAFEGLGYAR